METFQAVAPSHALVVGQVHVVNGCDMRHPVHIHSRRILDALQVSLLGCPQLINGIYKYTNTHTPCVMFTLYATPSPYYHDVSIVWMFCFLGNMLFCTGCFEEAHSTLVQPSGTLQFQVKYTN